jgi:hypothetical protein
MHCNGVPIWIPEAATTFFLHDGGLIHDDTFIFFLCVFRDTPMLTAGLGRPFAFYGRIFFWWDLNEDGAID